MRHVEIVPVAPATIAGNGPALSVSIAASVSSPAISSPILRSARAVPILSSLLVLSCPAV
jgi:hypothetical protein